MRGERAEPRGRHPRCGHKARNQGEAAAREPTRPPGRLFGCRKRDFRGFTDLAWIKCQGTDVAIATPRVGSRAAGADRRGPGRGSVQLKDTRFESARKFRDKACYFVGKSTLFNSAGDKPIICKTYAVATAPTMETRIVREFRTSWFRAFTHQGERNSSARSIPLIVRE